MRLLAQLAQQGTITGEQAGLIRAAVSTQALSVPMPDTVKNALRARLLKVMLAESARQAEAQTGNDT